MKKLVVLLVMGLMATAAFAVNDPGQDSFGIYFGSFDMDTGEPIVADNTVNCTQAAVLDDVIMYVVLMNPKGPVDGAGFTLTRSGTALWYGGWTPTLMVADWLDFDGAALGWAVGGSPVPTVNGGMTIMSIQFTVKNVGPYFFNVKKPSSPSITGNLTLPEVTGGGVLRACSVASGDVNLPVATINGGCPVANEPATFGSVKSLFR